MTTEAIKAKRVSFANSAGLRVVYREEEDHGIQVFTNSAKNTILFFGGRRAKPDLYSYVKPENFDDEVEKRVNSIVKYKAARIEQKEKLNKQRKSANVGDIFVCSWGYEQTNVDFYQVVETVGKATVKLRKIGARSTPTGRDQGTVVPVPNSFVNDEILTKRLNVYGQISMNSFSTAFPLEYTEVDGVKVYKGSYYSTYY